MAYKKIERQLVSINDLCGICGLFTNQTDKNGGYGCKSKSKDKQELGCCYAWDCPLAYVADLEDFKKYNKDLYNEYTEDENCDWVVQYREIL
jgi:hypothetical protein